MTLFQHPARVPFFFGTLACIIHFDAFWGLHQWIRIHDHFDGWFVHLKVLADLFIKHGIFFWDPTSLTGNQAIASLYTTPFHPASLLLHALPLWCLYSIWKIGASFLAGWGLYLYLKHIEKLSIFASLCGGIFFLGISIHLNLSWVLTYSLPLFLYLFYNLFEVQGTRRLMYFLCIVLLFWFSFPHVTVPVISLFHFISLSILPLHKQKQKAYFWGAIALWLLYSLMHAPIFYSFFTESMIAHRQAGSQGLLYAQSSWIDALIYACNRYLILTKVQMNTLNILPFLFLVLALCLSWKHNRCIKWCLLFFLLLVVGSIYHYEAGAQWMDALGTFFQAIQPSRLLDMTLSFMMSVLAAYGIFFIEQNKSVRPFFRIILPIFFATFICILYQFTEISMKALLFFSPLSLMSVIVVAYISYKDKLSLKLFIIPVLFMLMSYKAGVLMSYGTTTYANFMSVPHSVPNDDSFSFHKHEGRIATVNIKGQHPKQVTALQYHGVEVLEGYASLYPLHFKEFWHLLIKSYLNHDPQELRTFNAFGSRVYLWGRFASTSWDSPHREIVLDISPDLLALLNVRYLISRFPVHSFNALGLSLVNQPFGKDHTHWIYKVDKAYPRAFLTRSTQLNHGIQDGPIQGSQAKISFYSPDLIRIAGYTPEDANLVYIGAFHKKWNAILNGKQTNIFPAYHTFRGIRIERGTFEVEFSYKDRWLSAFYIVMIICLFGSVVTLLICAKQKWN